MVRFNIEEYDTVDARLTRFWEEHPNGAVHTELITDPHTIATFLAIRATVWFDRADPLPAGQGIAYGQVDAGGRSVDATSWVENCDTSAVGRALANAGYKAKKDSPRPSAEEMAVAESRQRTAEPRRMEPRERQQVDATHQKIINDERPAVARSGAAPTHRIRGPAPRALSKAQLLKALAMDGWNFAPDAGVKQIAQDIEFQYDGDTIPTNESGSYWPSDIWDFVAAKNEDAAEGGVGRETP